LWLSFAGPVVARAALALGERSRIVLLCFIQSPHETRMAQILYVTNILIEFGALALCSRR
jgi:hypothetical protein